MSRNIFDFDKRMKVNLKYNYYFSRWYRIHRIYFLSLVYQGRKLYAFNFLQQLKFELKLREDIDPYWIFLISMLKLIPEITLFPKKLGGRIQGVPLPILEWKQYTFIIKWTLRLLRLKFRKISLTALVDLFIDTLGNKGDAIEKKLLLYQTGIDNRHLLRFFKR